MMKSYYIILVIMVGISYCDNFNKLNKPKEKPEVFSLLGDIKGIICLAISKDSRYVILGGKDNIVRVWDMKTGILKELKGHTDGVTSVAILNDDKYVISTSLDKTIRVWDIEKGKEVKKIEMYKDEVTSVAISTDGRFVVFGGQDKTVRIWDIEKNKEVKRLEGHTKRVTSVAISTNSRFVVSASDDTTIRVWDIETGKEIKKLEVRKGISSLALSADGSYVLSGAYNYKEDKDDFFNVFAYFETELTLWDINIGKKVWIDRANYKYYKYQYYDKKQKFFIDMSLDGKYVVSGVDINNIIRLLDGKTGKVIRTFKLHTDVVNSLAISMDGRYVVSGNLDNTVSLWDIETGKEIRRFKGYTDGVTSVVFSSDGRYIVSGSVGSEGSGEGAVRVWDLKTGKEIRRVVVGGEIKNSLKDSPNINFFPDVELTISPDSKYVLSNEWADAVDLENPWTEPMRLADITLWEIVTGKKIMELREGSLSIFSTNFSYDSRFVLLGGAEGIYNDFGIIILIDVKTGKEIKRFTISSLLERESNAGFGPTVKSVAISPDNRHIIYGDSEGMIGLLDIKTGKVIKSMKGDARSFVISPDGKYVVFDSEDNTVRVWDIKTGNVKELKGHTDHITSFAIFPDNKYVVSGSKDNTIKVWDVETGKEIKKFEGHKDGIISVAISPEGRYIVAGIGDGTIRLLDINTGNVIAQFVGYKDGEWVVLTPEGYYNVSKNGEKYLKVRIGNEVYDIEKYRDKFYKPEKVRVRE